MKGCTIYPRDAKAAIIPTVTVVLPTPDDVPDITKAAKLDDGDSGAGGTVGLCVLERGEFVPIGTDALLAVSIQQQVASLQAFIINDCLSVIWY